MRLKTEKFDGEYEGIDFHHSITHCKHVTSDQASLFSFDNGRYSQAAFVLACVANNPKCNAALKKCEGKFVPLKPKKAPTKAKKRRSAAEVALPARNTFPPTPIAAPPKSYPAKRVVPEPTPVLREKGGKR